MVFWATSIELNDIFICDFIINFIVFEIWLMRTIYTNKDLL